MKTSLSNFEPDVEGKRTGKVQEKQSERMNCLRLVPKSGPAKWLAVGLKLATPAQP